jgi:hypothetical protein
VTCVSPTAPNADAADVDKGEFANARDDRSFRDATIERGTARLRSEMTVLRPSRAVGRAADFA